MLTGRFLRMGYTLVLCGLLPVMLLHLLIKSRSNPTYRRRWSERFARLNHLDLKPGGIVLHAVSVGELHAAAPVIKHLLQQHQSLPITITTTTPTASAQVKHLFGAHVQHLYLPFDLPWLVKRFFAKLQPRMLLIMEAEIWPNLFHQATTQTPNKMRVAILNARLSSHSAKQHQRFYPLAKATLANLDWIAAQTDTHAQRYLQSGANPNNCQVTGNLKLDLQIAPEQYSHAQRLKQQLSGHVLLLLASSHEGEEELLIKTFLKLRQQFKPLILVLAPRHPERANRVLQLCQHYQLKVQTISENPIPNHQTDVILVDVLGQLLAWYGASKLAILGGSLVPIGGHNPIEAAAMGCPLIIGPYRDNILELAIHLSAEGSAKLINSELALEPRLVELLTSTQMIKNMEGAGIKLIQQQGGALATTLDWINQELSDCSSSTTA